MLEGLLHLLGMNMYRSHSTAFEVHSVLKQRLLTILFMAFPSVSLFCGSLHNVSRFLCIL